MRPGEEVGLKGRYLSLGTQLNICVYVCKCGTLCVIQADELESVTGTVVLYIPLLTQWLKWDQVTVTHPASLAPNNWSNDASNPAEMFSECLPVSIFKYFTMVSYSMFCIEIWI